MQITNDTRIEALRKAPQHIQDLHGSLETGRLLRHLEEVYGISNLDFISFIGDIILGFYPKADFRKLLVGLVGVTPDVAVAVEKDLSTLLFKIDGVPIAPVAPKDIRSPLELRPHETTPPLPESGYADVPVKPLTREDILRSITPKRTMASDIESVRRDRN